MSRGPRVPSSCAEASASTACSTTGSAALTCGRRICQKSEENSPGTLETVRWVNQSNECLCSGRSSVRNPGLMLPGIIEVWRLLPPPHTPYPPQSLPASRHLWQQGLASSHLTLRILVPCQCKILKRLVAKRRLTCKSDNQSSPSSRLVVLGASLTGRSNCVRSMRCRWV